MAKTHGQFYMGNSFRILFAVLLVVGGNAIDQRLLSALKRLAECWRNSATWDFERVLNIPF
jgi:hypothetical protein